MIEHVSTCWKSRPLYLERLTLVVVGMSFTHCYTNPTQCDVSFVFCLCVKGFVCNVVFAVAQLLLDTVDFNTHILAVFMINQFVYSIFYVVMKMKKREGFMTRRIWIYPFLYLLAALAFWLTGSYFFLKRAAAKWEVCTLRMKGGEDEERRKERRTKRVKVSLSTSRRRHRLAADTAAAAGRRDGEGRVVVVLDHLKNIYKLETN